MTDPNQTAVTQRPELPARDLRVDFGAPAPGSSQPMKPERRATYELRIRNADAAQAAGAEKVSKLYVR